MKIQSITTPQVTMFPQYEILEVKIKCAQAYMVRKKLFGPKVYVADWKVVVYERDSLYKIHERILFETRDLQEAQFVYFDVLDQMGISPRETHINFVVKDTIDNLPSKLASPSKHERELAEMLVSFRRNSRKDLI